MFATGPSTVIRLREPSSANHSPTRPVPCSSGQARSRSPIPLFSTLQQWSRLTKMYGRPSTFSTGMLKSASSVTVARQMSMLPICVACTASFSAPSWALS